MSFSRNMQGNLPNTNMDIMKDNNLIPWATKIDMIAKILPPFFARYRNASISILGTMLLACWSVLDHSKTTCFPHQ